jgi:CBS domain containing-hemolysin-like protein
MLDRPVPRQTPNSQPPAVDGSAAEDPFPASPARAAQPPSKAARRRVPVLGLAPVVLLPGGTVLAHSQLPTVTLAATVSPLDLTLSLAGILLAGFGTWAATGLGGYSPALLKQLAEDGDQRAEAMAGDLDRHDREYLVVAFAYTAIGWLVGLHFLLRGVDAANHALALAVFLGVMLLIGGSLPVAVGHARAERTLVAVLPWVRGAWWLLRWPLVLPLLAVTRFCLLVLGVKVAASRDAAEVQKQVLAAVEDSTSEAPLAESERTWIGNIVALKELQVSTIMTPRPDIVAFPETLPVRELLEQALEHGFSRYPIYRERIDEIVGLFYVKDALRLLHQHGGKELDAPLGALLREPLFVPETMGAAQLLHRFQAENLHMAIVLDEYGTTAGLISVEDVLEEIVGEIGDEYDTPSAAEPKEEQITVVEAGRIVEVPARVSVAELNEALGSELPDDGDWETVAGLVIAACNRIPKIDEVVQVHSVEFKVLDADDRRLKRLRVSTLLAEPQDAR